MSVGGQRDGDDSGSRVGKGCSGEVTDGSPDFSSPPDLPDFMNPAPEQIAAAADHIIAGRPFSDIGPGCLDLRFADDGAELPEPKLQFLFDYWKRLPRRAGPWPERKDIDILDLRQVIGNIMMLDALDDGFDARFRVYGTCIAEFASRDWTGHRLSALGRGIRTPLMLFYRACYLAAYRSGRPLYSEHVLPGWRVELSWRRVILPFSKGGGSKGGGSKGGASKGGASKGGISKGEAGQSAEAGEILPAGFMVGNIPGKPSFPYRDDPY